MRGAAPLEFRRQEVWGDLVELVRARSGSTSGYTFLDELDGPVTSDLTYGQLDVRARALAAVLQERGLAGERILLLYPPGLEYVVGFFGCAMAGAVAVPVFPPDPSRLDRTMPRLAAVVADGDPQAVLTVADLLEPLRETARDVPGTARLVDRPWLASDQVEDAAADSWREPCVRPDDTVLLQYTSGSTGSPRGVRISHANLLHNSALISKAFDASPSSRGLSWLPLYHDMGLIGGVLQPLFTDFPVVLSSPLAFLSRPVSWLTAISRHRITISGGPDFAFRLCTRKATPELCDGLDLTPWRVAFDGAEPVRASTIEEFTRAFQDHGFDPRSFLPCYGLAEATLIVTATPAAAPPTISAVSGTGLSNSVASAPGPADERRLVSVGRPVADVRVVVVAPTSQSGRHGAGTGLGDTEPVRVLADREVGEIAVSSPSVSAGYWHSTEAPLDCFESEGRRWLRTGDLGFLEDGELYVTGRAKDLVVIRGRNIYPTDVERATEAVPGIRPGCVAAFSVDAGADDGEQLVVVAEVSDEVSDDELEGLAGRVRVEVELAVDVVAADVALIGARTVPKTSSGKIQRRAARAAYVGGTLAIRRACGLRAAEDLVVDVPRLETLPAGEQRDAALGYLSDLLAAATGVPRSEVTPTTSPAALGVNSIVAMELLHRIERDQQVSLPFSRVWGADSVATLADALVAGHRGASEVAAASEESNDGDPDGELSEGERALWLAHRLRPESAAYRISRAFTVRHGADDGLAARLDTALVDLVTRHRALRSAVVEHNGVPRRRFVEPPRRVLDVVEVPAARLEATVAAELTEPFDLESGRLLRATLVRSAGETVLVVSVHHIACDMWAFGTLLAELDQSMAPGGDAARPRRASTSPSVLVRREQEVLAARGEELVAFWRDTLMGLAVLRLPGVDRPALTRGAGALVRREWGEELDAAVDRLARASRVTPFVVLLTAFQLVLQRFSGTDDIAVATPVAQCREGELAGVVGYGLNNVVLRGDLTGDPTFRRLLERNRGRVAGAFSHMDLPFGRLTTAVPGLKGRSAPSQVMLTLEESVGDSALSGLAVGEPDVELRMGDLRLVSRPVPHRGAALDLTLRVGRLADRTVASFEYDVDVLGEATVEAMADELLATLDAAVGNPELRISALGRATDPGTDGWNPRPAPLPDILLHELISRVADSEPSRVAVLDVLGRETTYGELLDLARAAAAGLCARGVGPEDRVGVLLPRGADAVATILAVLLAGGAYVPLDPATPSGRHRDILADSGARLVVVADTQSPPLGDGVEPVTLPELVAYGHGRRSPAPRTVATQLAYVMYTSGSTGRPKGVEVSHANLLASTWARTTWFPHRVNRFLLISSLAFDSSVAGLFHTLVQGGTLVFPEDARSHDPRHHRELLSRHRISHFESVPPVHAQLLDLLEPGELPDLVSVVVAGEACPTSVWERHQELLPAADLVNEYGPTETTVWCSAYRAGPGSAARTVPLGRPVANARLYVVDRLLRPVPDGVPGELLVGGAGVARGYHAGPGLTAERFLPDPWSDEPGARLYRTGDLVRLLPSGDLEFLGRADDQVQVAGVRVEPGAVEAALRSCPEVGEAVVRATTEPGQGIRLHAFVTPASSASPPTATAVRRWLLNRVDGSHLPSAFWLVDELPITERGKVDGDALRSRAVPLLTEEAPGAVDRAPAAPTDPVGAQVCALMAEVLGRPTIGPDQDFFLAGGHSLLVMQLVARLRDAFGIEISPRDIFERPTAAAVSSLTRDALRSGGPGSRPRPRPDPSEPALLSFMQQRVWFLEKLQPGRVDYHIPVGLWVRGGLDVGALERSLDEAVARHESLRTRFREEEHGPVQVIDPEGGCAVRLVRLADVDADSRRERALEVLHSSVRDPFDLATGPLIRAVVVELEPEEHAVAVTMHHIVSDGWSLSLLSDEIAARYAGEFAESDHPGPSLTYRDFSAWQRERVAQPAFDERVDRRVTELMGAPVLELPPDRPRPQVQTTAGSTVEWRLGDDIAEDVRRMVRQHGATLYIVLFAAFAWVVGRAGHRDDLVVGTPTSGRTHTELEGMVGFFANILPVRVDLSSDPSFSELIGRVRDASSAAFAYEDVPFELLVDRLRPDRDLSRNPLFQVAFALQNVPRPTPVLPQLDVEVLNLDTGTAKFDVTVAAWEEDGTVVGTAEYNSDLYERATVEQLIANFERALRAACAAPEAPLSTLSRNLVDVPATAAPPSSVEAVGTDQHLAHGGPSVLEHRLKTGTLTWHEDGGQWSARAIGEPAFRVVDIFGGTVEDGATGLLQLDDPGWASTEDTERLVVRRTRSGLRLVRVESVGDPDQEVEYVAPRDDLERLVVAVWGQHLPEVDPADLGIRDDFFDLGGHSLLATRIVAQLLAIVQTEVSLESFFLSPTVEGVVAEIRRAEPEPGRADRIAPLWLAAAGLAAPTSAPGTDVSVSDRGKDRVER